MGPTVERERAEKPFRAITALSPIITVAAVSSAPAAPNGSRWWLVSEPGRMSAGNNSKNFQRADLFANHYASSAQTRFMGQSASNLIICNARQDQPRMVYAWLSERPSISFTVQEQPGQTGA
jgi:hypothetical protein